MTVVTWKWPPREGYRSTFGPVAVNTLASMVRRHYSSVDRFVCVTNDGAGLDASIEVVPDREDFASVPSPHGGQNPSCYRRLRMFAPDAGETFGARFVSLDLDTVITGDLRPVWDRPEDIVLWGDTNPQKGSHYNGSMVLMTAGCRTRVWDSFRPESSPRLARSAGSFGSDQGWISYTLGPSEARWTTRDGVFSYRVHLASQSVLPPEARVVSFHGPNDPWSPQVQAAHPWVSEHWR